ncbi:MAG: hypothetical protein HC945_01455 [Nitrosarchaeum sp.]|nr:hypothetical protein [Nitrosarchaeum sp.]
MKQGQHIRREQPPKYAPGQTRHIQNSSISLTILITTIITLLLPHLTLAAGTGSITLLTVGEDNTGGTASLYLTIAPGSGSIYLDSLPLSKLDTQSSTRYANQIACNYLDLDCTRYDFFYRIRADSSVVGGPSAGAAMTVLTISLLSNTPLDDSTVITGTINSGGLIGPVAGIAAKARAAKHKDSTASSSRPGKSRSTTPLRAPTSQESSKSQPSMKPSRSSQARTGTERQPTSPCLKNTASAWTSSRKNCANAQHNSKKRRAQAGRNLWTRATSPPDQPRQRNEATATPRPASASHATSNYAGSSLKTQAARTSSRPSWLSAPACEPSKRNSQSANSRHSMTSRPS